MKARLARRSDLPAIQAIGSESIYRSYTGFLAPATIQAWIEGVYSNESLANRWSDHPMYVAEADGVVTSFADAFIEDERIFLSALFTRPLYRRAGAGAALVGVVRRMAETLPVTCDVLLGSDDSEPFFEKLRFVPGETLRVTIYGEPVVERRWYLDPLAEDTTVAGATSYML